MTMVSLKGLNTEQRNEATMDIDSVSTMEMLKKINNEDKKVPLAVEQEIEHIAPLVDACANAVTNGGRVIYIGAGTSGRLGVIDASECPPTYGVSPELIQGIMAGGSSAMFKAKEGVEDDPELAKQDLMNINLCNKDVVIGLAASGRTPYVIGGLEYANSLGCVTGSICCVNNGKVSAVATYPIEVITGAEAITGSTRMKAGTAQKLVLNMISTATMIKFGKVYSNLMVDVQPTNQKLITRATNIIANATGLDLDKSKSLLEESNHNVKVAIIMGLLNCSSAVAIETLAKNNGNVSSTINHLK